MHVTLFILANIVIGYLFGSCSFSIIIGKYLLNKDPRDYGSGNAGATNAFRLYGKKFGSLILLLDILKVLVPTLIIWGATNSITETPFSPEMDSHYYFYNPFNPYSLIYLCPFFAIIGHCFPLYFHFKGGKGAACYGTFIWLLSPWMGIIATIVFILVAKKSKMVSFAVLFVAAFAPVLVLIPGINYLYLENIAPYVTLRVFKQYGSLLFVFFLMCASTLLVVYQHRSNIQRIRNHNERTIAEIFSNKKVNLSKVKKVNEETNTPSSNDTTSTDFVIVESKENEFPQDVQSYKDNKNITHELTIVETSEETNIQEKEE